RRPARRQHVRGARSRARVRTDHRSGPRRLRRRADCVARRDGSSNLFVGRVDWTDEASRWLRRIYDYIAADNPEAAMRTIRGILGKAQMLARFPEMGQRYVRHTDRHIRILRYGHYRIAYLVKPGGNVDVLGV